MNKLGFRGNKLAILTALAATAFGSLRYRVAPTTRIRVDSEETQRATVAAAEAKRSRKLAKRAALVAAGKVA